MDLAPWYYRNLISNNSFITLKWYHVSLFDNEEYFEANAYLNSQPDWISKSELYNYCDGTGTDKFKNRAIYKSISEALERLAFYETVDSEKLKYCFDVNPSTTGMAAFPHFRVKYARDNARNEAVERWAIHEFNRSNLPVIQSEDSYAGIQAYEIKVPFNDVSVCILSLCENNNYSYAFAAAKDFQLAKARAKIELNRNREILKKNKSKFFLDYSDTVDRTLVYFSTEEGNGRFRNLVEKSPKKILRENPKIICDKEVVGHWSKYTKVWRYLLEDSYFDCSKDHTFFMF